MPNLEAAISESDASYLDNRTGMLALLDRVRSYAQRAIAASEASRTRFEKRGQLLPRERVAL